MEKRGTNSSQQKNARLQIRISRKNLSFFSMLPELSTRSLLLKGTTVKSHYYLGVMERL
jgi:hypothetical protein